MIAGEITADPRLSSLRMKRSHMFSDVPWKTKKGDKTCLEVQRSGIKENITGYSRRSTLPP